MDPFTQRMLEKAEQRSRALGISNAGNYPLTEFTEDISVGSAVNKTTEQKALKLPQQQSLQSQQQLAGMRSMPATSACVLTNTGSSRSAESGSNSSNKLQVVEKTPTDTVSASNKVLHQFTTVDKENMDLGIEINIMTDKNVEVQVHVDEQHLTDEDDERSRALSVTEHPVAKIRDTSRNRLQRLGALYANPSDLSSPIHRTEAQFHADSSAEKIVGNNTKRAQPRYGKLVALASSINQWEDDTTHHHYCHPDVSVPPSKPDFPSKKVSDVPPPKPALPSRNSGGEALKKMKAPAPPIPTSTSAADKTTESGDTEEVKSTRTLATTKQLTWDPQVINSLEAQGFQRRDSSTVKLAYDYAKDEDTNTIIVKGKDDDKHKIETQTVKDQSDKPKVAKLASTFSKITDVEDKKSSMNSTDSKVANIKPGTVSGRAAVFENKVNACQQAQRPQKDPTELSLKERMQLFERNKGEALVPKAALGMAPSISKIRQEQAAQRRVEGAKAANAALASAAANPTTLPTMKTSGEGKLREKVAALVANVSTIAEAKIKADIQKQRQEDMQMLSNRFNKQKEILSNNGEQAIQPEIILAPRPLQAQHQQQTDINNGIPHPPIPPPPPPMPKPVLAAKNKRRSPVDAIDDDESKRARKSATIISRPGAVRSRLYPALSDLESNESSEQDNGGTTATMSERSTADEHTHMIASAEHARSSAAERNTNDNHDDESYMDSEEPDDSSVGICNGSLGRVIMQVVQKNDNNQQQRQQREKQIKEVRYADKNDYYGGGDSSINSSEASMRVDDYLDEALADDGDDDSTEESADDADDAENASHASKGSKDTTTSNSFSFRKTPKKYTNYQTISEERNETSMSSSVISANTPQPVKSELSINREGDDNVVTLVHTVSFYRRQQNTNSANSTPVRKICREQQVLRSDVSNAACVAMKIDSPKQQDTDNFVNKKDATFSVDEVSRDDDDDSLTDEIDADVEHLVQEKIKKLLDEVCKQQTIIAQTSQALNLCAATIEFSGSTESVEGERHLLVASHRRQACLDEIQRLRVERSVRPQGAPREKGRLTVKEITIPLRQDYIRKLAADTISGHHLVCLLKYNEHVLATKTVPTLPGLLAVKFPDVLQLNNVHADFRITLEIYGMTAQREVLPHEVKYHINLNKKTGIKTPKKKSGENRLVMPPAQSPAGPNVVRTPALVQYGFAIFSLREVQRTSWTLTQVLGVSPLEGVVHMKANCELSVTVEHRGFLTMFEDISGFGAWHRRWCYLNGTVLSYWKYPDDERKKTPIGSIDLYSCHTQKVTVAPRDICARLNTMLLECVRPAEATDEESLIIVPKGRNTVVRYLLSADTKEEREQWCAYFNKSLTLLRAWGPPQ